jgi:GNAT superfamily N-acetyltransferase
MNDCQILPRSLIPQAAAVMAEAFVDSPAYNYMFQDFDKKRRQQALEWLFRRNLQIVISQHPSALRGIVTDSDEVVACFLWTPLLNKPTLLDMIQSGLWQVPLYFGFGSLRRLLETMRTLDEYARQYFGSSNGKEVVLLERMVVRPDYQGQGLGTKCLQTVLSWSTAQQVRLTTQLECNVRFYQRLGFQVVGETDCFMEQKQGYHCWFMVYDRLVEENQAAPDA